MVEDFVFEVAINVSDVESIDTSVSGISRSWDCINDCYVGESAKILMNLDPKKSGDVMSITRVTTYDHTFIGSAQVFDIHDDEEQIAELKFNSAIKRYTVPSFSITDQMTRLFVENQPEEGEDESQPLDALSTKKVVADIRFGTSYSNVINAGSMEYIGSTSTTTDDSSDKGLELYPPRPEEEKPFPPTPPTPPTPVKPSLGGELGDWDDNDDNIPTVEPEDVNNKN